MNGRMNGCPDVPPDMPTLSVISGPRPSSADPSRANPSRANPSRANPSSGDPSGAGPSRASPSPASLFALVIAFGLLLTACGHRPRHPSDPPALPESTATPALTTRDPPPATPAVEPNAIAPDQSERDPRHRPDHRTEGAAERVANPAFERDPLHRLRTILLAPTCDDGPSVERWLVRYRNQRPADRLRAAAPLLALVVEQVDRAGLPGQFALIPLIESDFQPLARGRNGPAGLWQFMPATARGHGLRVDARFDGRLSVLTATEAAIDHLGHLHRTFGDWRLAAMAYNAGEHRVRSALRRPARDASGLPSDLPTITRNYVDKLKALACLITDPVGNGIELPDLSDTVAPKPVLLPEGSFAFADLAEAIGLDVVRLRRLNGGHRHDHIDSDTPRTLLIPGDHPTPPAATLAALAQAPARSHIVNTGDSLWALARRYRVSVEDLRRWNRLPETAILQPGQRLRLAP